jgi:hypothetical protein
MRAGGVGGHNVLHANAASMRNCSQLTASAAQRAAANSVHAKPLCYVTRYDMLSSAAGKQNAANILTYCKAGTTFYHQQARACGTTHRPSASHFH